MTIHGLGLAPHKVVREARMCACIMGNLSNRKFSAQMSRGKEAEGHPGTRLPTGLMSLVCCLSYPTSLKPVSQHVPIIYHEPSSRGNLWKFSGSFQDRLSWLRCMWRFLILYMGDNMRRYDVYLRLVRCEARNHSFSVSMNKRAYCNAMSKTLTFRCLPSRTYTKIINDERPRLNVNRVRNCLQYHLSIQNFV